MSNLKKKSLVGWAMAAALVSCLVGCRTEGAFSGMDAAPEATPDAAPETGALVVTPNPLPEGISCIRASVKAGARSELRQHEVGPAPSASFTLEGLPTGDVQLSLEAFAMPCDNVSEGSMPTWSSEQQLVFVSRGALTTLDVVLRPNPIGIWDFDDTMGSLVLDASGKGNVGEVVQGTSPAAPAIQPTLVQGRKTGSKALDLTGGHTWMRVKSSDSLNDITPTFSIAAWVKSSTPAMGTEAVLWRQEGDAAWPGFGLGFFKGRAIAATHYYYITSVKVSARDGSWQHLAATFDGITVRLFENGEQTAAQDVGHPLGPLPTDVTIGAAQYADLDSTRVARDFFPGVVDEVHLFSAVLTPSQIKQMASQ